MEPTTTALITGALVGLFLGISGAVILIYHAIKNGDEWIDKRSGK